MAERVFHYREVELPVGEDARVLRSVPNYPRQCSGPALVVGSGPGFMGEYEEASRLRPGAFIVAVNKAAGFVRADAIFSLHHAEMSRFVRAHDLAWGTREMRPETHSGCRDSEAMLAKLNELYGTWIDYLWPIANSWGSSGWAAGKMCRAMGYDEVVLCGVPLAQEDGTYWRDWKDVGNYREGMRREAELEPDVAAGIKSMSGYTREILGAPEGA